MIGNNFSRLPYEACLIPNLPEEIQHRVRDMTTYFVQPLYMLLALVAFVCNSLICITVARTKSLKRPSLLLLSSLSVTDLIFALFSLYMGIKILLREHMCLATMESEERAIVVLCSLATLGTLAVISRDRYLAVKKPWWYRNHVSTSRAIQMSCIPWLISVIMTFIHIVYFVYKIDGGYKHFVTAITFMYYCICVIIIIFSHLGTYFKKPPVVGIRELQAVMKREKKSAATIRLILLVLLLTFFPALLFPIVLGLKGRENLGPYRAFMFFLFIVDTVANPLLNFGRNRDMRRAIRGLLSCSQHVKQRQHRQNNKINSNNNSSSNNNNISNNNNNNNNRNNNNNNDDNNNNDNNNNNNTEQQQQQQQQQQLQL